LIEQAKIIKAEKDREQEQKANRITFIRLYDQFIRDNAVILGGETSCGGGVKTGLKDESGNDIKLAAGLGAQYTASQGFVNGDEKDDKKCIQNMIANAKSRQELKNTDKRYQTHKFLCLTIWKDFRKPVVEAIYNMLAQIDENNINLDTVYQKFDELKKNFPQLELKVPKRSDSGQKFLQLA